MAVLTIFDFAIVAFVGAIAGALYGLGKMGKSRFARVRPSFLTALIVSGLPALCFLVISCSGITGIVSGEFPVSQWLAAGLLIVTFVFVTFGLPFVAGAMIAPFRKRNVTSS